ncbi:MAG: hypothetical protein AAGI54_10655 [Planctomycetota bacterium]
MQWWQVILFPIGCFILLIPVVLIYERHRLRQAEVNFLEGRSPLPDREFLHSFDLGVFDPQDVLQARQITAQQCGVEAEFIYPDDAVKSLCMLQFDGGDMLQWLMLLEVELKGLEREVHAIYKMSFREFIIFCLERKEKTPA